MGRGAGAEREPSSVRKGTGEADVGGAPRARRDRPREAVSATRTKKRIDQTVAVARPSLAVAFEQ